MLFRTNLCTSNECVKVDVPTTIRVPEERIANFLKTCFNAELLSSAKDSLCVLYKLVLPDMTVLLYGRYIFAGLEEHTLGKKVKLKLKLTPSTLVIYTEDVLNHYWVIFYVNKNGELATPYAVTCEDEVIGGVKVKYLKVVVPGKTFRLPFVVGEGNALFESVEPYVCEDEFKGEFWRCKLTLSETTESSRKQSGEPGTS